MNVDHQEIAKFEAVASRWWDLEGEFKPLHQMNPLRLEWIQRHSEGLFGKQILDVGCGGGILSESMARQGAHVLGLDMGKEPLQVARLHALESGVEVNYRQDTVEALAERFGVTLQTVRRDVKLLAEAGLLARFHGGVRLPMSTTENIAYRQRQDLHAEAK